ncbi:MAG: folate-binding protein [Pseudomonadota bacterium]
MMGRKLLRVTGSDRVDFLQTLVTNEVSGLSGGLVYAALLTPQGKLIADFFLVPDGDGILIDVDARVAAVLAQRLGLYKLRADVTLDWDTRRVAQGLGAPPEGAFPDPRHATLGWRAYGAETATIEDWDARRVAACIPEWGAELGPDTFILEAGFDRMAGVDFRKGCYVGQEVTARMKHKTELQKGIARVAVDGPAAPGTEITSGGKTIGTLHTRAGDEALAFLRFNRIGDRMTAGHADLRLL